MKPIQKHIKSKLKDNSDLIDTALIDNTLTAEENQTILNGYINPLLSIEDKIPELIQEQQTFISKSKQQIWKEVRCCFN